VNIDRRPMSNSSTLTDDDPALTTRIIAACPRR
jgi:hypothetical protein